jgi:hypothetical protein
MAAASGQYNCYDIFLQNDPKISPVNDIILYTNRCVVEKNYIVLHLHKNLRNSEGMSRISKYIAERFKDIDTRLLTTKLYSFDEEVKCDLIKSGREVPTQIEVPNYKCARVVIDILFKNKEMTDENRCEIAAPLKELEKSAEFASRRKKEISLAQKECIESMISPYIAEIKKVTTDKETITKWIEFVAKDWCDHSAEFIEMLFVNDVFDNLGTKNSPKKSKLFYESILAVAKFYNSMGELEGALVQLGKDLPNAEITHKTVLDCFDHSTSK